MNESSGGNTCRGLKVKGEGATKESVISTDEAVRLEVLLTEGDVEEGKEETGDGKLQGD